MKLLTQNKDLKPHGIFNWTLPAWVIKLTDGSNFNVCPNAGACAKFCYARNGTYLFSNVKKRHTWNLELTKDRPQEFKDLMISECSTEKMQGKYVRIHDAGDFYSLDYLKLWLEIIKACPKVTFYCYTKEVKMFKDHIEKDCPDNLKYLYSLGGREDYLIDKEKDRHAEVFPDDAAILDAGYSSQDDSDLLSITLPSNKIGIPANNIKHFNKKINGRTFGSIQEEIDIKKESKLGRL